MAQIRTNKNVYTSRKGDKCFISREMVSFNQDKTREKFVSVVKEVAFLDSETDILDPETGLPLVDEDGNPTGEKEYKRLIIEVLGTAAHSISYDHVNELFSEIGKTIDHSSLFTDEFDKLQGIALLIDTKPKELFNTELDDWVVDNGGAIETP